MLNPNVVIKNIVKTPFVDTSLTLLARMSLVYIFIVAGWCKLSAYTDTVAYMQSMGVPGALLPLTILVELGGGLALLLGFQTRLAALGLAIFSIMTGLIFHSGAEDSISLMKNLAMSGGLFALMLHGAGRLSVDHAIEK